MRSDELKTLIESLYKNDLGRKIISSFESTIQTHGMIENIQKGVLVGFSGGADSVMLISLLYLLSRKMNFKITAVHINHMIRGDEAYRDEKFAEDFSMSLGIDYVCRRIDIPNFAKEHKLGTEEAARIARYNAFSEIAETHKDIHCIATAHNSTDNLETVLFNLFRGSGSRGMKGIAPVRENIIRPLINISKQTITDVLDSVGIPYVVDSTNLSDDYTRNIIRNKILPEIRKISINPENTVSRFCSNISEDFDYINSIADNFIAKNKLNDKISVSELIELHPAILGRVLIKFISSYSSVSPEFTHINSIKKLLEKNNNFNVDIPGNLSFVSTDGYCFIQPRTINEKKINNESEYKIKEGINIIPELNIAVLLTRDVNEVFSSNVYNFSIQADISSAIIDTDLFIRTRRDGDSYYYGGMTRKVKRLFSDHKIPVKERDMIPILCDRKGIVWVAGFHSRDDGGCENNPPLWVKIYKKLS